MNLYETDVLFHSVACSEHCLCKKVSPRPLCQFSPGTSHYLPAFLSDHKTQLSVLLFQLVAKKLKSKTVYGEAVYGFDYFMQISSITFQSIRQTVAEGSPLRSFHWQLVNFRSEHFQFIFTAPHSPLSPIELFTLLPPVTICNTHRGWRTVQFWLWLPPSPVDWLSVGRSACPSVCHSLNRNETRRVASNEFVLCLPKGFSIESVKYHNLQSNPKSSAAHFSFPPPRCPATMKMMKQPCRTRM